MRYCPNCSAEFKTVRPPRSCWNCDADFSRASAWRPTDAPMGPFRPFRKDVQPAAPEARPEPEERREEAIQQGSRAFTTILRLFVGLATIIPLVIALDPQFPWPTRALYGGGVLLGLAIILTIGRHYDFAMGLFFLAVGSFAALGGLSPSEQPSLAHSLLMMGGSAVLAGLLGARGRPWPRPVGWLLNAAVSAVGVPLVWLGLGNLLLAGGIVCIGLGILHLSALSALSGQSGSR